MGATGRLSRLARMHRRLTRVVSDSTRAISPGGHFRPAANRVREPQSGECPTYAAAGCCLLIGKLGRSSRRSVTGTVSGAKRSPLATPTHTTPLPMVR